MSIRFVQMADPQFGMFSAFSKLNEEQKNERIESGMKLRFIENIVHGTENETRLFSRAIEITNRLEPLFVVICGDMTHDQDSLGQRSEVLRLSRRLNEKIDLHWVPGNHDVGSVPTKDSLAKYRNNYGADNYSFNKVDHYFIVVNSAICFDPSNVQEEWLTLKKFLSSELHKSDLYSSNGAILFMHHPLFLEKAEEEDSSHTIPTKNRKELLNIIEKHNVRAIYSGHLHRNNYAKYGQIDLISSGSVGYTLGSDPSGIRLVELNGKDMCHRYLSLEE